MFGEDLDFNKKFVVSIEFKENFDQIDYCMDSKDLKFCEESKIGDFDIFESVMDKLDKEWYKIKDKELKKIKKIIPEEFCDVCVRKETEDDPILVCQGCSISVHRDCYGSSFAKEEFFLCQCCIFYYLEPICKFCGFKNGTMKLTDNFKFGHILCVLFDKSLDFDNPISKEPIYTKDYKILKGKCIFCNSNDSEYTKLECSYGICMNVYHLGCSLDKTYFDINNKISYCPLHDPSKSKNMFTSSASFRNLYSGYVKLSENPLIRKKVDLTLWRDTDYKKIIKSDPKILEKNLNELELSFDKKMVDKISKYWTVKRTTNKRYGISYLRHKLD